MQDRNQLTKMQLLYEIDRLTNKVQELELALCNRDNELELLAAIQETPRKADRSISKFIRLALFPLIAGIFRAIYNRVYRVKK